MRTCIIADNQFITSEGVISLLKRVFGIETFIRVNNLKELQNELRLDPSAIVILDYTLFDFVSVEQMLVVKLANKSSSWLLFSEELAESFLRHVLIVDSSISIVMKQDSEEELMEALQNVNNDTRYVCENVKYLLDNKQLNTVTPRDLLTASEKSVLREIALGKTTKEIAFEKNLSFHTVNAHRKNIFRKLEVNNLHEAIKYAIRSGVIDIAEYYI